MSRQFLDGPTQTVNLLAASSPGASYAFSTILTPLTTTDLTLDTSSLTLPSPYGTGYHEYQLTYLVTANDLYIGDYIGVSFATTGAPGSYGQFDNFEMTEDMIPEPATYALLLAGIGGLFLVRGSRIYT